MKVGVIDYGIGNLGSVMRALEELRVDPIRVSEATLASSLDRLILPGVGNFADCARILKEQGWFDALNEHVLREKPLLGICLGMQLLASSSTEGADSSGDTTVAGLNFIPGRVVHLTALGCSFRVPHVGWNDVAVRQNDALLMKKIPDGTDFYFVHSYAFVPDNSGHILATTDYGVAITAAVGLGSVYGTQFHPEKSSRAGFQVLRNFIGRS